MNIVNCHRLYKTVTVVSDYKNPAEQYSVIAASFQAKAMTPV